MTDRWSVSPGDADLVTRVGRMNGTCEEGDLLAAGTMLRTLAGHLSYSRAMQAVPRVKTDGISASRLRCGPASRVTGDPAHSLSTWPYNY